jgi:hypothetical protein
MAELESLYGQFFYYDFNEKENNKPVKLDTKLIEEKIDKREEEINLILDDIKDNNIEDLKNEMKKSLNSNMKLFCFKDLKELIEYLKSYNKQDLVVYKFSKKVIDYSFLEFKGIIVQLDDKQIKWSWEYLDLVKSGLTGTLPLVEHIYNYYWEDNPFIPFLIFIYADLIEYDRFLLENEMGINVIINKYNEIENRDVFMAVYHNYIDFPINSNLSFFYSWTLNQFILTKIKWKPFAIYGNLISGYLVYKENEKYIIVSPEGSKFNLPNSYSVKKKSYIKINRKPKEYNFIDNYSENEGEKILVKLSGIEFDNFTMSYWKSKIKYLINGDNEGQLIFSISDIKSINNIINYLESYQTGIPSSKPNFIIEENIDCPAKIVDTLILLKFILIIVFTSTKEQIEDFINVVYQVDGDDYHKQVNLLSNIICNNGLILLENCFIYKEIKCYPHKGLYGWFKKWVETRKCNIPIFMLRVLNFNGNSETEVNSIHSRINNIGFLNIINYPNKKTIKICATFPRSNEIEYRKLLLGLLITS